MWEDEARVMDDQKGGAKNGRSLQNSWGIHSMNEMALRPTAMEERLPVSIGYILSLCRAVGCALLDTGNRV